MPPTLNFNQTEIMARVLFLHRLKRACLSPRSHLAVAALLLLAACSLVSVVDVVANWWQAGDSYHYALEAINHTGLIVQLVLAGLGLFLFLLARDIFQAVKFHRHFATV